MVVREARLLMLEAEYPDFGGCSWISKESKVQ
jgi:hypothetical protein